VREKLVAFLQREYPHALPTARVELLAQAAGAGQRAGGQAEVVAAPAAERTGAPARHHQRDRYAA
jgi:hypothetical protein